VEYFYVDLLGQAPGLLSNIRLGLERLASDKRSNALQKFVNYGCKKFYNIGPSYQCCKLFTDVIYKFL
jgi:hypothetical protein